MQKRESKAVQKLRESVRKQIKHALVEADDTTTKSSGTGKPSVWQCYRCNQPPAAAGASITHGLCKQCFDNEQKELDKINADRYSKASNVGKVYAPNGELIDPDDDEAWERAFGPPKKIGETWVKTGTLFEAIGCGCGWTCPTCCPEDYDPEGELDLEVPASTTATGETTGKRTRILGRDAIMHRLNFIPDTEE